MVREFPQEESFFSSKKGCPFKLIASFFTFPHIEGDSQGTDSLQEFIKVDWLLFFSGFFLCCQPFLFCLFCVSNTKYRNCSI